MTMAEAVVGAALLIAAPILLFVSAKLVAYGWRLGNHRFEEHYLRRSDDAEEE